MHCSGNDFYPLVYHGHRDMWWDHTVHMIDMMTQTMDIKSGQASLSPSPTRCAMRKISGGEKGGVSFVLLCVVWFVWFDVVVWYCCLTIVLGIVLWDGSDDY